MVAKIENTVFRRGRKERKSFTSYQPLKEPRKKKKITKPGNSAEQGQERNMKGMPWIMPLKSRDARDFTFQILKSVPLTTCNGIKL